MSGGRVRAAIAMMRKSLNDLELLIEPDNDPFDGFPPEVVEVHMRDGEIHRRAAPGVVSSASIPSEVEPAIQRIGVAMTHRTSIEHGPTWRTATADHREGGWTLVAMDRADG